MAVNSTHASLSCFCSHLQLDTRCMHAHVPVRGAVSITSGMLGVICVSSLMLGKWDTAS